MIDHVGHVGNKRDRSTHFLRGLSRLIGRHVRGMRVWAQAIENNDVGPFSNETGFLADFISVSVISKLFARFCLGKDETEHLNFTVW